MKPSVRAAIRSSGRRLTLDSPLHHPHRLVQRGRRTKGLWHNRRPPRPARTRTGRARAHLSIRRRRRKVLPPGGGPPPVDVPALEQVQISDGLLGAIRGWRGRVVRHQPADPSNLILDSAPPLADIVAAGFGCVPQTEWSHRFPGPYRGRVFVQFSASVHEPSQEVPVTILWGDDEWASTVEVHPDAVSRGVGGTLLAFDKLGSTDEEPPDPNPPVLFRSAVAVCAAFGTTETRPRPAPALSLATPNWRKR